MQIIDEGDGDADTKEEDGDHENISPFIQGPPWLIDIASEVTAGFMANIPDLDDFPPQMIQNGYQATPLTADADTTLEQVILAAAAQSDQLLFFWAQQNNEEQTVEAGVVLATDHQGLLFIMTDLENAYNYPTYCPAFGDWLKMTFDEGNILEVFSFKKI
ncbi:MAG: hypothetical protein ACR2PT_04930 [Endozoicomonas sp.]